MKNINFISIILLIFISTSSFSQNWLWSKQVGGALNETCGTNSICIDSNGYIYSYGILESNPCFVDDDTLQTLNGESDFFIAKHDVSGNLLWAKSFGGYNTLYESEWISDVLYSFINNKLYIYGQFYGNCILGDDTLASRGSSDVFIACLDPNGNFIWVKQIGGSGEDIAYAMALDNDCNIYTSLSLSAGGTIGSQVLLSGIYFSKLDLNGNLIWAEKKFNANGTSFGYDAQILRIKIINNQIFGIGLCSVDSFVVDTVTVLTSLSSRQNIICCMDTNHATVRWMKACGSSFPQMMNISADRESNIYITGDFKYDAIFDNDTLQSSNTSEMFLVKYDSLGHKIWSKQTISSHSAEGSSIAQDYDGGIYLIGSMTGTVILDSFTVNTSTNGDIFVARFNSIGNCIGLAQIGDGIGSSILVDTDNNIYINGHFSNSITFGSTPTLTTYGQSDVFLAKCDAITGVGEELRMANNQLLIYANPTKGICNVTIPDEFKHEHTLYLQVFDLGGKLLQESTLEMQGGEIKINLEQEAKGIYNINLSNRTKTYRGKVVFE